MTEIGQIYKYQVIPIDLDFTDQMDFDLSAVQKLKPFFDFDILASGEQEHRLWFQNLLVLAGQNLGLAHCVLHNQSARQVLSLAGRSRPYDAGINAYHLYKPHSDTLRLDGERLHGTSVWTSALHSADYIVTRALGDQDQKYIVFLDLSKIDYEISAGYHDLIGMQPAHPSDITVDVVIPGDWILYQDPKSVSIVTNLHNYGLITNQIGITIRLLEDIRNFCRIRGQKVDYDLDKLAMQIDMARVTWDLNMPSTCQRELTPDFWHQRDVQNKFIRKILIDMLAFYMEVTNTNTYSMSSHTGRTFRDAPVMSSHINNLYQKIAPIDPGGSISD